MNGLTTAPRRASHVVWDWNGTLLDDFELTARVGGESLAALGVPGIDAERFRDAFTRPFSDFYARLVGREITAAEFAFLRERYETDYTAHAHAVSLQADADAALEYVASRAASQSILSMAQHDHLQELIDHHQLRSYFVRVEGSRTGSSDGSKAASLCDHLDELGVDPPAAALIGDTVDDFEAAVTCGLRAVLVTTGSQSRQALEATGAPVTDSLLVAARIATGDAEAS